MKYNENNKPLVCMLTQSTCYQGTTTGRPVGILWHDTAGGNPYLKRYVQPSDNDPNKAQLLALLGKNKYNNDFNHIYRQAGLNAWIGKLADGTITTVQTMPWNYRPWGCGGGSKGSCNGSASVTNSPFWIQFEICDDFYKDVNYFKAVYKEACEFTAYICKMFNIDPKGYYTYNGVRVPTILCHKDSHDLGLGSNHGDVYLWFKAFPNFKKTMNDVRNDVAALLTEETTAPDPAPSDPSPSNPSPAPSEGEIKVGSLVKIKQGATYYSGKAIPAWVMAKNWYVKSIKGNRVVIDKSEDGKASIMSPININYLSLANSGQNTNTFEPYRIRVNTAVLNIRKGTGTNYSTNGSIHKGEVYTIVGEADGVGATKWGKLKSGAGFISLDYVVKL